jgi:cytochrome c oxidase cbb3-type subunit III
MLTQLNNRFPKTGFLVMPLALLTAPAFAEDVAAAPAADAPMPPEIILLIATAVFLGVLVLLFGAIVIYQARPLLRKLYEHPAIQNTWSGRMLGLFVGDPVVLTGKATDHLLEAHDYDGIHEYDNDLPPWWKALFWGTIGFAGVYLVFFHVTASGALSLEEYQGEMAQAALLTQQLGANDDPNKPTDYKPLLASADLKIGHDLFTQNCAACHGRAGEGAVGPNLTDEYWLHGGEVNKVYHTIKYGVQGKGMVAWKGKLSGKQMLQVASYILSLHGTNPANPKAPQGEKEATAGAPVATNAAPSSQP